MNKKFTKLISVCIGIAFCAVPMIGQTIMSAVEISKENGDLTSVELRAGENMLDSIVTYTASGEKIRKKDYVNINPEYEDMRGRIYTRYIWKNNAWVFDEVWANTTVALGYFEEYGTFQVPMLSDHGRHFSVPTGMQTTYDTNGKPITVSNDNEIYHIIYNENSKPVSITWRHLTIDISYEANYDYDESGNAIFFADYFFGLNWSNTTCNKMTAKYDSKGKQTYEDLFYSNVLGSNPVWILESYDVFYYSDDNTANEAVTAPTPTAYTYNGVIYLQSPRSEQVIIYSLTGAKVYEGAVQAGTTTLTARFPKGIYIVSFSGGTRQKVLVSE
jgi:hypothetical protein